MITAKDAKKMTQDNVAERDEVITHRIEESVLAAVKQCRFYANVYTCKGISADQIAQVAKENGYQWKINRAHDQRDTDYVEIKWAEA